MNVLLTAPAAVNAATPPKTSGAGSLWTNRSGLSIARLIRVSIASLFLRNRWNAPAPMPTVAERPMAPHTALCHGLIACEKTQFIAFTIVSSFCNSLTTCTRARLLTNAVSVRSSVLACATLTSFVIPSACTRISSERLQRMMQRSSSQTCVLRMTSDRQYVPLVVLPERRVYALDFRRYAFHFLEAKRLPQVAIALYGVYNRAFRLAHR